MSDLLFENDGWCATVAEFDMPIPFVLPSRVPTQPDISVEPDTLPRLQSAPPVEHRRSRCYFCPDEPHDDVNGIPMCEPCQDRFGRK